MRAALRYLHTMRSLILCMLLGGCAPFAQPWQVAETAEVLKGGSVRITAGGGLGLFQDDVRAEDGSRYWGGGVGGRFRIGIGKRQEVGAEATLLWGHPDTSPYNFAAKLSYKRALVDGWLAAVAGLGGGGDLKSGYRDGKGGAIGTDVALILSHSLFIVEPYLAARVGLFQPLSGGLPHAGLLLAGGAAFKLLPFLQLFVEGGIPADFYRENGDGQHYYGYYGLAALSLRIGL